jgi:hypothetical protein
VRKTRSILEELNSISVDRNKDFVVENRGEHVIKSAINLIEQIENNYGAAVSKDLKNRLINSIRSGDASKFSRGIKKVIKESQGKKDAITRTVSKQSDAD